MSEKTISLNPDFMNLSGKKKNKTISHKKKTKPICDKQNSNKLRKELLNRIKNYQKKNRRNWYRK